MQKCAKCAELHQTAGKQTATYTYAGITHTHLACPFLAQRKGSS